MCEQEKLEKKKAKHAKKMKNKIAMIHKEAEETRALVEAKRGEYLLKAEETAAKYRSTGHIPKKGIGCFSSLVFLQKDEQFFSAHQSPLCCRVACISTVIQI